MMMKKPRPVREKVRVERRLVGLGRREGQGCHGIYFPSTYMAALSWTCQSRPAGCSQEGAEGREERLLEGGWGRVLS